MQRKEAPHLNIETYWGCLSPIRSGPRFWESGEHPSLAIGPLLETHQHDIGDILRESMEHEREALATYKDLLSLVEGKFVMLEEYARRLIAAEEMHQGEVDKMLRRPGAVAAFSEAKAP